MTVLKCLAAFLLISDIASASPNWSQGAIIPEEGRGNIYEFPQDIYLQKRRQGLIHTQVYPVTVTGVLPPYRPIRRVLEEDNNNPLRRWIQSIMRDLSGFDSFKGILVDLGLHKYPSVTESGIYSIPHPPEYSDIELMGFGLIKRNGAEGFTFSCAACHSSNLFGKTVLGMTNRFPRANEFFLKAQKVIPNVNPEIFKLYTGATRAETDLLAEAKEHFQYVALKRPLTLGLDTSLAQVALSLNRRSLDSYASYNPHFAQNPRKDNFLDNSPADSKPAVWWNLKYKNRWLSDGSVISGNPIFTNIIWNEVGRGADLQVLERWLAQNENVIEELTTAVFSTQAPHITDFFPAEKIELEKAKAGEIIFNRTCSACHGRYEKAWSQPNASELSAKELLKTVAVKYHAQTPVIDVGTDPYRRIGMRSLEQLNNLAISQKNNILIKAQPGYVPPPLVGIWARWPYFHNNSIPNLCALLTPAKKRPVIYYSGPALNPATDFDFECNGYPLELKTPAAWKKKPEHRFDTRVPGLGNQGHDFMFMDNGLEIFSALEKRQLILYLQTL